MSGTAVRTPSMSVGMTQLALQNPGNLCYPHVTAYLLASAQIPLKCQWHRYFSQHAVRLCTQQT